MQQVGQMARRPVLSEAAGAARAAPPGTRTGRGRGGSGALASPLHAGLGDSQITSPQAPHPQGPPMSWAVALLVGVFLKTKGKVSQNTLASGIRKDASI